MLTEILRYGFTEGQVLLREVLLRKFSEFTFLLYFSCLSEFDLRTQYLEALVELVLWLRHQLYGFLGWF